MEQKKNYSYKQTGNPILLQRTVPPGTKRFHYDFIDYMLLKMY